MAEKKSDIAAQRRMASLALNQIQKATRFFRLYPRSHPFCQKAVSDIGQRLESYHQKYGNLEVEVRRDGLYMEDQCVLADTGQSTDLSSILYFEGVFGLSLLRAATDEEVTDLVDIVSASYRETSDEVTDLLTTLWERNFQGIDVKISDPLAPGRPTEDPDLLRLANRIHELTADALEDLLPAKGTLWSTNQQSDPVSRMLVQLDAEASLVPQADPAQTERYLNTHAGRDRALLVSELTVATLPDLAARAEYSIDWAQRQGIIERVEDEAMARFHAATILSALVKGKLDRASRLIAKLAGDAPTISPDASKRMGSIRALKLVAIALRERARDETPDELIQSGLAYLSKLSPAAVASAVEVYPTLDADDAVRRVFRRFLSAHAAGEAAAIEPLTLHDHEAIVKEGVGILAMGGKSGPSWELLKRMADDDLHPARRDLAKLVVGKVTGTVKVEKLLDVVVGDQDPQRRIAAVVRILKEGHQAAYAPLSQLVQQKGFGERSEEEILAVFAVLQKLGGSRSFLVFKELAGRKTGFFGRKNKGDVKLRTLASRWLAGKMT